MTTLPPSSQPTNLPLETLCSTLNLIPMKKFTLGLFLLLIFQMVSSQNNHLKIDSYKYLWVFSDKAYIISDTIAKHDTLAALSWCDSIKYKREANSYFPTLFQFDNSSWLKVIFNNKTGWIKYNDITLIKRVIKNSDYFVSAQVSYGDGLPLWRKFVILNKSNKVVKEFKNTYLDEGKWQDNQTFLFCNYQNIFSYNIIKDTVHILGTARKFIINPEFKKIVYLEEKHYYDNINMKDTCEILLKSINYNGKAEKELYSIKSINLKLGLDYDDYYFIDLKMDKLENINCYSFWITRNNHQEQVFINWDGKLLKTLTNPR